VRFRFCLYRHENSRPWRDDDDDDDDYSDVLVCLFSFCVYVCVFVCACVCLIWCKVLSTGMLPEEVWIVFCLLRIVVLALDMTWMRFIYRSFWGCQVAEGCGCFGQGS
jgi:apolipoprotein N-acyltransferase